MVQRKLAIELNPRPKYDQMRRQTLGLRYKKGFSPFQLSFATSFNFCDVYSNSWKPTEEDITFEINKVRLLSIGQPKRFTLVFGKSVEAFWTRIKHNTFFRVVFCYVLWFWLFALNTIYLTNKELKIHYRDSAWINLVMIILKWHV